MPVMPPPSRSPRRRAVAVAAALAVLVGGGVAIGATSGSGAGAHLEAWTLDAPSLPLPGEGVGGVRNDGPVPDVAHDRAPDEAQPSRTRDAGRDDTLPSGAPSDRQVTAELERSLGRKPGSGVNARTLVSSATLDDHGLATIPPDAPPAVASIIQGGNQVAHKPYVYGGGHGRLAGEIWSDSAYDCSGSVSYALAAAGLIKAPMDSSGLARFGKPGPGKWVTIYANAGHAFMFVAGLRFDTSGRHGDRGSRWQSATRGVSGFHEVHPKGL